MRKLSVALTIALSMGGFASKAICEPASQPLDDLYTRAVSDIPETIGGYPIFAVLTGPATANAKAAPRADGPAGVNLPVVRQPCMMPGEKRLVLQSPQPTIEDALRDFPRDRMEQELRALDLAEYTHTWTLVGPGVTRAQLVKQLKTSSRLSRAHGCTPLGPPTKTGHVLAHGEKQTLPAQSCSALPPVDGERKCPDPVPGRAIIETGGLGQGIHYNAQSVYLEASTVGNNQGTCFFSLFGEQCRNNISFLNNVVTNSDYFLQAGLLFEGPMNTHPLGEKGRAVWTDLDHDLHPNDFPFDYIAGHTYWTTITHSTGGPWWICALDTADTSTYKCYDSPNTDKYPNKGTHVKADPNTSIWVENFNTNSEWYLGSKPFDPQNWTAHDAKLYIDGSPRDWTSEQQTTADHCPTPWWPGDAIFGSLVKTAANPEGSAYFILKHIPLYCE